MTSTASRPTPRTAAITNLGCKVNQAEMEAAARLLRERGIRIVAGGSAADLHLVNTCTVTHVADQKSRQAVRRARRASPDGEVVVTGCSVQVGPEAFAAADPAARLVSNGSKDALLAELAGLVGGGAADAAERAEAAEPAEATDAAEAVDVGRRAPLPTLSGVEVEGIADDRAAVERTRAFVKVQDGCSFFCTYCIIPAARGPERSLAPEIVLGDVRRALAAGHREIVLTGINIGTYDGGRSERGPRGSHATSALTLAGLIRRILAETDVERLRLSSIEPQHVDDELLDAWTVGGGRCLPHFHLPLQSGDDGVLRRMGRRYDTRFYASLVDRIRAAIAGVAIHGDVITGFPTEDDDAWSRSLAFIESIGFAGIHVFRYSARPGTPAVRMAGQVGEAVRKRRAGDLLRLAAAARARFAAAHVGRRADVLFETRLDEVRWIGHAADHQVVSVAADGDVENAIGEVSIDAVDAARPDRVAGTLLALDLPRRRPRGPLPLLRREVAHAT